MRPFRNRKLGVSRPWVPLFVLIVCSVTALIIAGFGVSLRAKDAVPLSPLACVPPPSNMVAWWRLDETSGTTALDSAGSNNGVISGATSITGEVNGARHFDGLSNLITVPTSASLNFGTGNLSFDAWIRTTHNASDVLVILDKRNSSNVGYEVWFYQGHVHFQLNAVNLGDSGFIATGAWVHVAITVDRTSTSGGLFWVNGVNVSTFNPSGVTATLDNTSPLYLGRHKDGGGFFPGDLDEIELFNRVLTGPEISGIFNAGASGKCKCTATSGATIFTAAMLPANPNNNPHDRQIEVGVKFRSDVAGLVTGVRFYKDPTNTGAHTGSLWSSTGVELATATFTNETPSGWQDVSFASPVLIAANTTYTASYHTTTGYVFDGGYFQGSAVNNPPLHGLQDGADGPNGVFVYDVHGFPTGGSLLSPGTNWWVDVKFYATCDDGLYCNGVEFCNPSLGCQPGTPPNCDDGIACTLDSCNEATDSCNHVPQNSACDDGNPCTDDSCNPATGCAHTNNTATCNDGNACTFSDTCSGGTCGGTAITCTSDQCNVRTCNGTSSCAVTPRANGTTCNDGNACTQTDNCQSGTCIGSNPVVCTASDQCHVAGTCNTGTGVCTNPNKANGTACSDGNACTQTDTCQTGVCTGSNRVVCTASDQCHVAGACNTGTGVCTNPNKANGTTCSDGNACTQTDTCQTGVCTGSNPVVCTASDQCHVAGTCIPATGCTNPNASSGTPCNDNNACTLGDICSGGNCQGTAALDCDDHCPFTTDSCVPATGCAHTALPPELCDGLDNNCNGLIDEGNPQGGAVCGTGHPGVCGVGTVYCIAGQLQCIQNRGPGAEICNNGIDENCNGMADDTTGDDPDGDLLGSCVDNCPYSWNPDQTDSDGDGIGDACDCTPEPSPVKDSPSEGIQVSKPALGPGGIPMIHWGPVSGVTRYDVYRGYFAAGTPFLQPTPYPSGAANYTQECFAPNVLAGDIPDNQIPPPFHGFFYLIAAECPLGGPQSSLGNGRNNGFPNDRIQVPHSCPTPAQDSDGDGVKDALDNCPTWYNPTQYDAPDHDGHATTHCDNCLTVFNPDQADRDLDGIGDACDRDIDNDGVSDYLASETAGVDPPDRHACTGGATTNCTDNCPFVQNFGQGDRDVYPPGDPQAGLPHADGVGDTCDNCPDDYNPDQLDTDGDGCGDVCQALGRCARRIVAH